LKGRSSPSKTCFSFISSEWRIQGNPSRLVGYDRGPCEFVSFRCPDVSRLSFSIVGLQAIPQDSAMVCNRNCQAWRNLESPRPAVHLGKSGDSVLSQCSGRKSKEYLRWNSLMLNFNFAASLHAGDVTWLLRCDRPPALRGSASSDFLKRSFTMLLLAKRALASCWRGTDTSENFRVQNTLHS
jgi:hypothetical protein